MGVSDRGTGNIWYTYDCDCISDESIDTEVLVSRKKDLREYTETHATMK